MGVISICWFFCPPGFYAVGRAASMPSRGYSLYASVAARDNPEGQQWDSVKKRQIPVLCYHNIRTNTEGKSVAYTISVDKFRTHMAALADSGYNTILPDQLYEYLARGAALPSRPVIITFDDTREEHFTKAAPVLRRLGYKGVFFIMTVAIGKNNYMTAAQIKALSDSGHVIGCHTWDHPGVNTLSGSGWDVQITRPVSQLEKITGRPVKYFAYPRGEWNENAIHELKARGIKAAFQLSGKQSINEPLYTIRRLMVGGNWSAEALCRYIKTTFR